jgi:hypothetical protein
MRSNFIQVPLLVATTTVSYALMMQCMVPVLTFLNHERYIKLIEGTRCIQISTSGEHL